MGALQINASGDQVMTALDYSVLFFEGTETNSTTTLDPFHDHDIGDGLFGTWVYHDVGVYIVTVHLELTVAFGDPDEFAPNNFAFTVGGDQVAINNPDLGSEIVTLVPGANVLDFTGYVNVGGNLGGDQSYGFFIGLSGGSSTSSVSIGSGSYLRITETTECLGANFDATGTFGDTGRIMVPATVLGDTFQVSSSFEGGYATIGSGDAPCVTIHWVDGSTLYVEGVSQGNSGDVTVNSPNNKSFWFENASAGGTYSSPYTICLCPASPVASRSWTAMWG